MSDLHKVCVESCNTRLYATETGAAVSCTLQNQKAYDPDDGMEAGWYGWCGAVEDQSDYVLGPYASRGEVFQAYEKRNKTHIRCCKITLHQPCTGMHPTFIRHPDETKELPPAQTVASVEANQSRWEEILRKNDENTRRYWADRKARGLDCER
jgi:hypothetical protein